MTSPNDPWSNPYGQPPGQYGQPVQPAPGQYGPPGQYGVGPMPGQYGSPGGQQGPASPGLIVAGVVQIVQCVPFVIFGLVAILAGNTLADMVRDTGVGTSLGNGIRNALVVAGVLILAVSGTMIALAVFLFKRSNGARIASAVLQIVFGVFWLIALLNAAGNSSNPGAAVVYLASCVVVTVLLFGRAAARATTPPRW
ncbi:MAG TPA: hypothetical protein VLJ59_05715 [Mycobacteriales bacterium]|nr:hypothetical protein [Mycobacteriales bacterium]